MFRSWSYVWTVLLLAACGGAPQAETPSPEAPSAEPSAEQPSPELADNSAPQPASPAPAAGGYDACAGKKCGDTCTICDPNDANCVETMVLKVCNEKSVCSDQNPTCP